MIYKISVNVVNAAHVYCVIGRCTRHEWRQWNLFSLFCSTWRVVFRKCLRVQFGLSKWRSRKKPSRSCLHVRHTEKPRQKSSWRLEPKLEEIFTNWQLHHVTSLRENDSLENVCTIILLSLGSPWNFEVLIKSESMLIKVTDDYCIQWTLWDLTLKKFVRVVSEILRKALKVKI